MFRSASFASLLGDGDLVETIWPVSDDGRKHAGRSAVRSVASHALALLLGLPPNSSNADLGKSADASQSIIVGYPCIRVLVTWTFGRPSSAYQPLHIRWEVIATFSSTAMQRRALVRHDDQISLALRLGLVHIVSVL